MTVSFRAMQPQDRAFVVSMWSSSYRMSHSAGFISMGTWAEVMHREIKRIIDSPLVATTVAYSPSSPGEPDHLYGFISYEEDDDIPNPYVFYTAVKAPYRRARSRLGLQSGIAEQLFAAAGIDPRRPFRYACETPYVMEMRAKIPRAEFDPIHGRYLVTT